MVSLMNEFHDTVMFKKGTAEDQARFFLHPEPRIFVAHGEDLSLQTNYEIHQKLTGERHILLEPFTITPLCDDPERAHTVGAVYWEAHPFGIVRWRSDQVHRRRGLDCPAYPVGRA